MCKDGEGERSRGVRGAEVERGERGSKGAREKGREQERGRGKERYGLRGQAGCGGLERGGG